MVGGNYSIRQLTRGQSVGSPSGVREGALVGATGEALGASASDVPQVDG